MAGSIGVGELEIVADGISRPEDVLVHPDGRVFASDASAAVSELRPDGTHQPIGHAGGEPNGIALLPDGQLAIANFAAGTLQRLDLGTGAVAVLADRVDGRPLTCANYPVVDADGSIFVSCSSDLDPAIAMATGARDGSIVRVGVDGTTRVVCDGLPFPNCMTFDADREHLYVVLSTTSVVVRLRVLPDGELGAPEPYGPPLGTRGDDEYGPELVAAFGQPDVLARWGMADGCGFDADGNLWVTLLGANRIVAITPALDVVTVVDDPDGEVLQSPTSVAWGGADGRDVYIGSLFGTHVVKGRSTVAGMVPLAS
ncbi:MAG: gluconolactonase [Actinomycetota bacterium]|nr:gluconolactonase [Actinomycetota bacterium]